ncbi:unnamed protein product [Protopolystoma xenopodis]|uniref:Uncharacterized protein n=1 Tax=Protopolystoma xenopodis TaxID=117903 RepID=A0A3S5CDD1_9PLAT|nr:unnamed protein product [Protopolystoma xenopodis]
MQNAWHCKVFRHQKSLFTELYITNHFRAIFNLFFVLSVCHALHHFAYSITETSGTGHNYGLSNSTSYLRACGLLVWSQITPLCYGMSSALNFWIGLLVFAYLGPVLGLHLWQSARRVVRARTLVDELGLFAYILFQVGRTITLRCGVTVG